MAKITTPEEEIEQPEVVESEVDSGSAEAEVEASPEQEAETDPDEELVVTIGDEAPPEPEDPKQAPEWVRNLRVENRQKDRRIRELEQQIASAAPPAPAATVLGEKPTLEGCGYEAAKFETELEKWHERKLKVDQEARAAEEKQKAEREAWNAKVAAYDAAKAKLKVPNFAAAEDAVKSALDLTQQGILLAGADRPEVVVAALGNNPGKLRELAAIKDPIKFTVTMAKLEMQMKVAPRKSAPPPERAVRGNAGGAGAAVENQLEKLREEAAKTGDFTKVLAFKRQQAQKAA